MNPFHKLKLSNYISEDCGCADSGGGTGGAPVIQMAGKTTKHIITPSQKSKLVTEALVYINENALLDQLVLPDLAQKYIQKAPVTDKLSKYNVKEAKEIIGEEFKQDPDLPHKIVNNVNKIEESSPLGNIRNNITNRYQDFKPTTTKAGHLISTHNELSKSGDANSMMGSKQVIDNTLDEVNGKHHSKRGLKTESSNILEEMQSFTYNQLTKRKPVITAVRPSKPQPIATHYDKTIASPTHHLKAGEKILVANKLSEVKGNLQSDRDAIKKASSMEQSVK